MRSVEGAAMGCMRAICSGSLAVGVASACWSAPTRLLCVLLALAATPLVVSAVGQSPSLPNPNILENVSGGVTVQVLNEDGDFFSNQALITVRNLLTGADKWTVSAYRGEARFDGLTPGAYEIEVSAAGYATAIEKFEVNQTSFSMERVAVTLKPDASVPLNAPRISIVEETARKETQRGIEAIKAGQFKQAEKHLRKAYKRSPQSADLNYLLGVLYLEKNNLDQAKNYLGKALAVNSQHVRSLTAIGGLLSRQKDTAGAIPYLEKAVSLDPEQWMAQWLLADAYLKLAEYAKADQAARSALRAGKGAAFGARFPLGQALAQMGRFPEAIQELEAFLQEAPRSPVAPEARRIIAELKAAVAASETSPPAPVRTKPSTEIGTPEADLAAPSWGPPGVDEMKPPVARGVSCPEQRVIDGAADRLNEFIANLSRFEAAEELVHEDLDEVGNPLSHETRKFSYVAELSEPVPGVPRVDEYRNAGSGPATFPADIATRGLPGLIFVFHPYLRDTFALSCEGLGQWQGRATWLIYFRQRENRPNKLLSYNLGQGTTSVDLKGRAWVTADTFRIVHIEAEAIRPMPAIRMLSHRVMVDYGPVAFSKKAVQLWLPKQADVYFHFRGHRYHRRHRFDNFRLFSVDSTQKVVSPKEADVAGS